MTDRPVWDDRCDRCHHLGIHHLDAPPNLCLALAGDCECPGFALANPATCTHGGDVTHRMDGRVVCNRCETQLGRW